MILIQLRHAVVEFVVNTTKKEELAWNCTNALFFDDLDILYHHVYGQSLNMAYAKTQLGSITEYLAPIETMMHIDYTANQSIKGCKMQIHIAAVHAYRYT